MRAREARTGAMVRLPRPWRPVSRASIAGGRPGTAAAHGPAVSQVGRCAGGPAGRLDVQRAPGRACPLDAPVAGRPARCAGSRSRDWPRVCADYAQKNDLKPWQKKQRVIPPKANAEFVCAMEDVLAVYTRPYDPQRHVVCLDEASKQ